jgi:hypothetical protein
MILIELLRWLVETWPERRSYRPDMELVKAATTPEVTLQRIAKQTRLARRTLGEGEYQFLCSLAATVGAAAWAHEMPSWAPETSHTPEMWLRRWFTCFGTSEHIRRRVWAMDVLGRDKHQRCEPVETLDQLAERWLTRLRDFGAARVFEIAGHGPEIWSALPVRCDFVLNALIGADGTRLTDVNARIVGAERDLPRIGGTTDPLIATDTGTAQSAPPRQRQRPAPERDRVVTALLRDYPTKRSLEHF